MKALPGTQKTNALLADIAFIKRHKRFPIKGVMIAPFISWSVFMIVFSVMIVTFAMQLYQGQEDDGSLFALVILSVFLILAVFAMIRYWRSFQFVSMSSPGSTRDNAGKLNRFFRAHQLLAYQLPEHEGVFQIQSKPLPRGSKEIEREVVVFIADDDCILVNHHFTDSGFNPFTSRRNFKVIANQLGDWLKGNAASTIKVPPTNQP